tara:strand:- start:4234 stop:5004 length:771 start_codon:yes stop_codon:yes gene_type:complete
MGFFDSFTKPFKSLGRKISQGASFLGKKALKGLDYTIQGAKIATDTLDKYTGGLSGFIPYYGAIKAGIDISDHLRKMAKGEEKLNWTTGADMALSGLLGASGLNSAKAEIAGLKEGYNVLKGVGSVAGKVRGAGSAVLKGYGLHKNQLKEMVSDLGSGTVGLTKDLLKGKAEAYGTLTALTGAGIGYNELQKKIEQEKSNTRRNAGNTPLPIKDPVITKPISKLQSPAHPLHKRRPIMTFQDNTGAIVDKSGNVYG